MVVLPLAWVHREVAVPGSSLRPELSSLGYAGVGMLPDPHAPFRLHPFPVLPLHLPLLCLHMDGSGWGSLHMQHFPIRRWLVSVPASSATPLPLLPWAGGDGPVHDY